ncbi:hypothetical protein U1Q18_047418 [Sarracenia purpurea var. burkii]
MMRGALDQGRCQLGKVFFGQNLSGLDLLFTESIQRRRNWTVEKLKNGGAVQVSQSPAIGVSVVVGNRRCWVLIGEAAEDLIRCEDE